MKRIRVCKDGEFDPADYLPVSKKDNNKMYQDLLGLVDSVENTYLKQLLQAFFVEDEKFIKKFRRSSAAKTMHHGFVGGLLEHSLSVARCAIICAAAIPF